MSILARLSLANRSLVALATVALVAFGLVSTASLRQELIPSLQLPMAVTTTSYPGASPDIVDREVTQPLDQAISGVDGLSGTTATSSSGVSVVQAEFEYGTDIDQAVQELQQAVDRVGNSLPDGTESEVIAGSFDDVPVVMLAASSDADERDFVQDLEQTAAPELSAVAGVRDVEITGARTEQVTIDLDAEALAAAGIDATAVASALQANGVSVPGGELTVDDRTLPVEVGSHFDSVDELADLRLLPAAASPGADTGAGDVPPTGEAGEAGEQLPTDTGEAPPAEEAAPPAAPEPVRLGDVAEVRAELATADSITRTKGEPSIGLSVTKDPDGNTVSISHDVRDLLGDLEETIGDGATFSVVFDQAPFIEDSIEGLATEGGLGLVFAVLVILVFLLSVRSTLVTAVSIPLSILVAMIGLYVGGYTLNILTLGALTVAVGRVVDDSIVVLENIKRHLGYGEDKREAVLTGTREVAGAITASTLTTAGVFLPIAFVGGQAGELFRPFGVTVAIALLASLLVALTVIPVLAYWFLRPATASPQERARIHAEAVAAERRSPLQRAYVPVIRWATKHRAVTLLAGLAVFAGTVALAPLVQTNFLDASGQNTVAVTQTMPVGTSLDRADEAAQRVEQVLSEEEDVESYQVTIGGGGPFAAFAGGSANETSFSVTTDPEADQVALLDRLRSDLGALDDAGELRVSAGDAGGPGSSQVEVVVEATDPDVLAESAERVTAVVRDTPGTTDVTNNLADDQPGIQVVPDRAELAALGLSEAQLGQAVRAAFEGQQADSVLLGGEPRDVVLRTGEAPASADEIRALELPTPTGETVTVGDVAEVGEAESPAQLTRTDGERTASVSATPENTDVGSLSADLTQRLADLDLPSGASYELGGVSAEQEEAFGQLGIALLAAIAIVFLVMVGTFRSLAQPLILLVSVPFAATGAIGLLLLTDIALGVPALIGLLMLVGIVVTNAIVLIDLINQYRRQGMALREAVVEGGRQRLRPILMTALATIFALLPMALGLTGGGVFISQPLAVVVIGGLVSSTLLTLVLVPTLYTMVEGVKERRASRRGRRRDGAAAAAEQSPPSPDHADREDPAESVQAAAPLQRSAAAEAEADAPVTSTSGRPGLPPGPAARAAVTVPLVTEAAASAPAAAPASAGSHAAAQAAENGVGSEVTRVQVVQVEVVVRTPGAGHRLGSDG